MRADAECVLAFHINHIMVKRSVLLQITMECSHKTRALIACDMALKLTLFGVDEGGEEVVLRVCV